MREIKFRGKPSEDDEFIYGFYGKKPCKHCIGYCETTELEHFIISTKNYDPEGNFTIFHDTKVLRETVGQYTEKSDSESKEIYDGDIVDFTVFDMFGNDTQHTGLVEWHNCEFLLTDKFGDSWNLFWVLQQDDEAKIIGNIHEQKENDVG